MVAAKPDCTGERFGRLTVLGKGDRKPSGNTSIQLWRCQCDCGNTIEKPRKMFERHNGTKSCGCNRNWHLKEYSAKRAKPDCTGKRFGLLTVLGKSEKIIRRPNGSTRGFWDLQCDCGSIISLCRGDFDRVGNGQRSCGCLWQGRKGNRLIDNKQRSRLIPGERIGSLVAIELTGNHRKGQPTWLFQCDCGGTREESAKRIKAGYRQNCGNRAIHGWGLWYPPTPSPYPKEAGEIVAKYLHLTQWQGEKVDSRVEDEKRDRLIRCAWILTYRRQQGEQITEKHEQRYLRKSLIYTSLQVFWDRTLERNGGMLYNASGIKKVIGGEMTDATFQDYPVCESETQGNAILSTPKNLRRMKFKRM